MAKKKTAKKGSRNKSQAIRDQIAKNPSASANEIAEAASKQTGEVVTAALVYNVKATSGGAKKKRRKKKGMKSAAAPATASGGLNASLIREAAALLQHAGGDAKTAQQALSLATEVSKMLSK